MRRRSARLVVEFVPAAQRWCGRRTADPITNLKLRRCAGELECISEPLYVATLALHQTLYRYELLAALGRDWDFVQRINGTTAAPPLNTVKGCVNTAIVMSLCAFFDKKAAAANLKSILNDLRLVNLRRRSSILRA